MKQHWRGEVLYDTSRCVTTYPLKCHANPSLTFSKPSRLTGIDCFEGGVAQSHEQRAGVRVAKVRADGWHHVVVGNDTNEGAS